MVQLIETLDYKPEGCECDIGGFIEMFHLLKPSSPLMALGSTQSLTEMSTSGTSWEVKVVGAYG